MGHHSGQLDEGLDAAETLRDFEEAQSSEHSARFREPSLDLERHDPAEAVHLRSGNIMGRMIMQAGIVDPPHPGVVLQETRDLRGVFFVLPHAQRESFYSSQREKTIERGRRSAGGILQELEPLVERDLIEANRTADDVRMSREIFCRRVKHEIDAKLERPLENRRCECVVDQTQGAAAMGDVRCQPDIRDSEKRVGRRFDPDKPSPPSHGALDFSDIGGLNEGKREAETFQYRAKKPVGAAVHVARGDHVISLFEQEHRRSRRAHTGGEGKAVFGRLQARERRLERRARRIVGPRIVVALVNAGRSLSERAGLIDRNRDRPGRGFGFLSGVDRARGKLPGVAALLSCHQGCPPM